MPESGFRFSIVVPASDEVAVLADGLSLLQRQTYPGAYEIIVVDNGSTDGTARVAERLGAARTNVLGTATAYRASGLVHGARPPLEPVFPGQE